MVWGRYLIFRYLDPEGKPSKQSTRAGGDDVASGGLEIRPLHTQLKAQLAGGPPAVRVQLSQSIQKALTEENT